MPPLRAADRKALALVAIVAGLGLAPAAAAQTAASLSLDSDYRLRGVSLTDSEPAVSLALSYDHPSGAYLGGEAVAAHSSEGGIRRTGVLAYAGYAWRVRPGLSFDAGADWQDLEFYVGRSVRWRYSDAYVGLTAHNLSAHLYYSPDYLTHGSQVGYLSLDATRPADPWRLFAHLGLLEPLRRGPGLQALCLRYDGRVGLARTFSHGEVRLSLVGATPDLPGHRELTRPTVMVGVSIF